MDSDYDEDDCDDREDMEQMFGDYQHNGDIIVESGPYEVDDDDDEDDQDEYYDSDDQRISIEMSEEMKLKREFL